MKKTRVITAILAEVILMAGILSFLSGCFGKKDPDKPAGAPGGPDTAAQGSPENGGSAKKGGMPGELVGVRLEMSGGSMNFHSEFGIEVTPDEIVWAEYWPEEDYGIDITRKEHVPVTEAQWGDLVRIVGDLYEELEPVPEKQPDEDDDPPMGFDEGEPMILDGGDYHLFYLTWRTADGDKTVQYYNTSDRREQTLTALLMELAEPIGREIVWYEAPVISGVFYYDKKNDESLQCTRFDDGTYYFIARFYETPAAKKKGEKRDVTKIVSDEIWADFGAFLEPLELKSFPSGRSFDDPLAVTVYQSDGRQYTVRPDAETAEKIRAFFVEKAPVIAEMKSMR